MKIKTVDFEIDGYSVFATGEYFPEYSCIDNIQYQCNMEVDDEMDEIILDYCRKLLKEKAQDPEELYF